MKKLCVFTLYEELAGSSRYRAYIFKNNLEKQYDVSWFPFWNNYYIKHCMYNKRKHILEIAFLYMVSSIRRIYQLYFVAPKADIIFVQKDCIPHIRTAFWGRIKKKNKKIIFDIDDANFTRKHDNSDVLVRNANLVVCGNVQLFEHYSKLNRNCFIIPTVDVTDLYVPFWNDTFNNKIIGWIGSKVTAANLEVVVDALNTIIDKHPEVNFLIISDSDAGYAERIKNTQLLKWDLDTYLSNLSQISIGIMPLLDNEYNKGKCGFKLIQYLNMKKPVIGTGIGINESIINGNGFVANDTQSWVKFIELLLFDRETYDNAVHNIESSFFDNYSFESAYNKLISVFETEV